jgi:hypothetical protein
LDRVSTGSGSMKGLSRKKFSSCRQQFLAASLTSRAPFKLSHNAMAPGVQRISKPLPLTRPSSCRPFLFLLWSCRLHSRLRGHLQSRANHGSICDSSRLTGPMTISGYAWGHIVATGP